MISSFERKCRYTVAFATPAVDTIESIPTVWMPWRLKSSAATSTMWSEVALGTRALTTELFLRNAERAHTGSMPLEGGTER